MNPDLKNIGWLDVLRRDTLRKVQQIGVPQTLIHGVRKLLRVFKENISPKKLDADSFDKKYGTDTAQIISVGALDIPDQQLEHSNRYEAVVPEAFNAILDDLPVVHANYVFVDIGSGKGRALLLASRLPFKEIVGVEISAALTDIAIGNISIFKDADQRCRNIHPVCMDGTIYEPPSGDTILYLNNPFDGEVMRSLMINVEKSLHAAPRKIFVIYQRPLHRAVWDASAAFRRIRSTERYIVYESTNPERN